jgi:hypothetical protein
MILWVAERNKRKDALVITVTIMEYSLLKAIKQGVYAWQFYSTIQPSLIG